MKVLSVVEGGGWGGTKEQAYITAKYLKYKGVDISLAISFGYKEFEELIGALPPNMAPNIYYFEENKGSKSRYILKNYFRLSSIIEENEFDIIFANSPKALDYVRLIYPFLKKNQKL